MARGAPDYSNVKSGESLHRLDDLSEIPPRLGNVSSIDRAGDVVTVEDFRYGFAGVDTDEDALGSSVEVSAAFSRYGGYSCKLARVANALAWCNVALYAPSLETAKIGAEIQFCATTNDPVVQLYLARYTGTERLLWGLKWSGLTDQVYIGGETVGWTSIVTGYDIRQGVHNFHNAKLVVDVENENYERVIINGVNIPVVEKAAYAVSSTVIPYTAVTVENYGGTSLANEVYLDYIIITRNEP